MIAKIGLIASVCLFVCASANHPYQIQQQYRLARQQQAQAPYAPAGAQPSVPFDLPSETKVNTEYGAPPLPASAYGSPLPIPRPLNQYGAPLPPNDERTLATDENVDSELSSNETTDNPDSENLGGVQSARLQRFQKLRQQPRNQRQRFQRLELQSQRQQQQPKAQLFQRLELQPQRQQQQPTTQLFQRLELQPQRQQQQPNTQLFQRLEVAPVQQEGSYFIQLPNGSIQRVTYLAQPSLVDNSVAARLQFRPVVEAAATSVAEPQIYVNTLVQAYST